MSIDELKKKTKNELIDIITSYYNQISYLTKRLELIEEIYLDE